ncbi:unnamed protein product [Acanthosepion pharaonis]|uniref:Uncharacterized protein n=1 Tax=Acanthosepion pharaonis TaxID=158019 RepID=A0A812DW17_ACAPH|nr:unnamed protein product [Sepia pharaonis]
MMKYMNTKKRRKKPTNSKIPCLEKTFRLSKSPTFFRLRLFGKEGKKSLREKRRFSKERSKDASKISTPTWCQAIFKNYKGLPQCRRKPGGQPRLSEQTEKELIVLVSILIDFGILIDSFDIRCMVKGYLDKRGIVDAKFRGNLPGIDWVRMFMKRHDLSQQIAANVKNSRTFLTKEITSKYFEMLSEFIESIPPDRIYSYDEMNIIFEPDCETTIARRKYRDEIERKQDTSKERSVVRGRTTNDTSQN